MTHTPPIAVVLATLVAMLTAACGPQRIASPSRPESELIVLLPDAESGLVGRARVSNPSGSAELAAGREATQVATSQRPGPTHILSDGDVKRIFGGALSALPTPPRRFTLNFRFQSDELTAEARALLPEILKTVKDRSIPDVVVVGHTDTTGTPTANIHLGLKRATMVRNLLVKVGLDASSIEVTSLGEADLLIQTPNETPEPRNRRVEIAVR
jgi:outer membrane protein OmpA-like peptidoglycan-associated protein